MENAPGMMWLIFALCTVCCWGLYGIFLHAGQMAMGDPENALFKSFFIVGIAYLVTAVLGSAVILWMNGATWSFTSKGVIFSLIAGLVGAFGAFFVLLAFKSKGTPAVVMSIVFAGAPIINAVVALMLHPPKGGFGTLKPQFILGIALAALGGFMVSFYKPGPAKAKKADVAQIEHKAPQSD